MKLLTRHLTREIYASIALVFTALLLLFAFFDLIQELDTLGRGDYHLGYVLLFVLLTMPGHIYELFPVAILIGSIFALAQMAAHSELVVYRCSGVSVRQLVGVLLRMGVPLLFLSYLCGEILAPPSERLAQKLRLKAQNAEISLKEFRSGVWVKDELSFVNVKNVLPDLVSKDKALGDLLTTVHQGLNFTLLSLVAVHIAAALKHHFIQRNAILSRMLPFIKGDRP